MVTGSGLEHICPPAVHMFTPDPSQVTVWVAPALFPSYYLRPTPLLPSSLHPSPKGFPSYCRGNAAAQLNRCSRARPSHLNHAHATGQARAAELPQTPKDWLDSEVIKVIKAN